MFRLANDAFRENEELHNIAAYCLTETIKSHVEEYFEEEYHNEPSDSLYTKVKIDKVIALFPTEIIEGMRRSGVNSSTFIPKKVAQFLLLLKGLEEHTPDLFLEYILYRMIKKQAEKKYDYIPNSVSEKEKELKQLLRINFTKDDFDDIKERNIFIKNQIEVLTRFTSLLSPDQPEDSLAFWDWDFMFFEDWGFENVIKQSAYGILVGRGYGLQYTTSIFTDVGEDVPFILNAAV